MAESAVRSLTPDAGKPGQTRKLLPLVVRGLRLEIGQQKLLNGIDFQLADHGTTILLGPNGAGKTLLLRLCHGLLKPSSGTISWCGMSAAQTRNRQALVFQKPVLLRRSAAANIDYALRLHDLDRRTREQRISEALAMTDLSEIANRPARVLSGGEQQRLAIARALALRPQVLLLDEPCAHLDPSASHAVEELIRSVNASGVKILMTTHDLAQAKRLADEVLFMHKGHLLEQNTALNFFQNPNSAAASAYVRGELLHDQVI